MDIGPLGNMRGGGVVQAGDQVANFLLQCGHDCQRRVHVDVGGE